MVPEVQVKLLCTALLSMLMLYSNQMQKMIAIGCLPTLLMYARLCLKPDMIHTVFLCDVSDGQM